MDKQVNRIVITREQFGDDLYMVLGDLLEFLFKAEYECIVREEEDGIITVDFDYDRGLGYGNPIPMWVEQEFLDDLDAKIDKVATELFEEIFPFMAEEHDACKCKGECKCEKEEPKEEEKKESNKKEDAEFLAELTRLAELLSLIVE